MGRDLSKAQEGLADSPISVFSFKFRMHSRRCHLPLFDALPMPLASVRCIADATHIPATIVFSILTEVLGLRFHHWRWVSHLISDDQKLIGHDRPCASRRPDGCKEAKVVKLLDWR
jgi:hypothetical protein